VQESAIAPLVGTKKIGADRTMVKGGCSSALLLLLLLVSLLGSASVAAAGPSAASEAGSVLSSIFAAAASLPPPRTDACSTSECERVAVGAEDDTEGADGMEESRSTTENVSKAEAAEGEAWACGGAAAGTVPVASLLVGVVEEAPSANGAVVVSDELAEPWDEEDVEGVLGVEALLPAAAPSLAAASSNMGLRSPEDGKHS